MDSNYKQLREMEDFGDYLKSKTRMLETSLSDVEL